MNRRQCELKNFIRERISADTMALLIELVDETSKEHIEYMIEVNEHGEDLVRRQGRVQGMNEIKRLLEGIHRDPRANGGRNN